MSLPFISRRRHDDDLAEVEGKRRRLARWLADEKAANKRVTEELTAVSIVNTCLTKDLSKVREELTEARAQASDSLAGQLRAELKREKKRADRLQKELDDATFLPAGKVENSARWQPGYQDPKQATT